MLEQGSDTFWADTEYLKASSDEQKTAYKKKYKALNNKTDDVFKKVQELIDLKRGTALITKSHPAD